MCEERVVCLQSILRCLANRVPRIILQRAEEVYPSVREIMNSTIIKKELRGPFGETYPAYCDADQARNIKAEIISDTEEEEEEEENPMPVTFIEVKAEPENFGDMNPTSPDANEAMNIKAEKVSDTEKEEEDEEDPMPITFLEIKAEPEVTATKQ
ncbi:uncharacterized protein LOC111868656 isoform X3 [Cryptotermes secundus]|uniref:uncharacterized protein LOC111868656 isoform X3 n=1 Tax=Cryptotermes secundus TaxID=105785 RepID=UPI000CD7C6A8|nr:uncharacterized protein LOC111868656 isoform X3 [Cryptotermes secundus]